MHDNGAYVQSDSDEFVEWNTPLMNVLIDVNGECQRQRILQSEGRFEFTCADVGLSQFEKLAILAEEIGEVAREILTQKPLGKAGKALANDTDGTVAGLRKELVQVAAVAASWVEGIDRGMGRYR